MANKKFKTNPKKFRSKKKFDLDERNSKGVAYNDIAWYKKNSVIADNFNKLPFNYVVGNDLILDSADWAGYKALDVPVMCVFGIDWIADNPNDKNSILNQVATILYTLDRKANSGATNYEFADVFTSNVLGAIDIFCQIADLTRKLNLVNSYTWKNRTMPKVIIEEAFAIDYSDLVKNLNAYVGRFNTLLAAANTIKLPNQFDFVKAVMAQYTQVFKDADSDTGREQIFVGVKYFHHIYDPVGTEANPGGMVRLLSIKDMTGDVADSNADAVFMGRIANSISTPKMHTFGFELDILEKCIYRLISDQDFNTIQGDLEKAFGEGGSFIVSDVLKDIGAVYPVYSGEFRAAFENGRFLPVPNSASDKAVGNTSVTYLPGSEIKNEIRQTHDSNGRTSLEVKYQLKIANGNNAMPIAMEATTALISSTSDAPSVDDVIYMTRYCNTFKQLIASEIEATTKTGTWVGVRQCGCFLLYEGYIVTMKPQVNAALGNYGVVRTEQFSTGKAPEASLKMVIYSHMFEFFMQYWNNVVDGVYGRYVDMRLDNPKILHDSDLKGIHDAAFLSLWNLPFNKNF